MVYGQDLAMDHFAALQLEFRRYRALIERSIAQLDPADLHRSLGEGGNSIAILVQHLAGNLNSRFTDFLIADGEKPWRTRDAEFEAPADEPAEELLAAFNRAWDVVERALDECRAAGDGVLDRDVSIRGVALTVREAWNRSLAHFAYHTGQIVLLARTFVGEPDWESLSIPRGGSAAYAARPDREKGLDGAPDVGSA